MTNTKPILYETHLHTPLCKHATGRPEEYAAVAERRGLKGIIVTCHNPTNDGWSPQTRMNLEQ
ncbi:MAG: histidinol-phosphatase, partial [Gammaproteobacteria bacterium]|nr:histidinol-phosphatase [Gammaproteobacteria bacterium]